MCVLLLLLAGLPTAAAAVGAGSSAAAAAGSSAAAAGAGAGADATSPVAAAAGSPAAATAAVNSTPAKEHHSAPRSNSHPEAPQAAVTPAPRVTDHLHDDPSPTSDQPAARQKVGAGTSAAKLWASTAAAAAAAAGTQSGRLPACSREDPPLRPAADWLHGSNASVGTLMRQGGIDAVVDLGDVCSAGMDSLVKAGLLHRVGCTEQLRTKSKNSKTKEIVHKALFLINYEGRDLQAQQWQQQEDDLPTLIPSSAASAAGVKEAFESGRAHPAVQVQVHFRKPRGKSWYVMGSSVGCTLPLDCCQADQLSNPGNRCFRAIFAINAVVLLLWHAEGSSSIQSCSR